MTVPARGTTTVDTYARAMLNELQANAYKGDWNQMTLEGALWDAWYHLLKLTLEITTIPASAPVLEYAADVGNHAMFLAERHGALTVTVTAPAVASDRPWRDDLDRASAQLVQFLAQLGITVPAEALLPEYDKEAP